MRRGNRKKMKVYLNLFNLHVNNVCCCCFVGHVDLSVRKRKAPDDDDFTLQNNAKRAKDSAVVL